MLRKDFLFDPYQVYEARAIGADTYLLIVDILSPAQLAELIQLGSELGMTPLVETHDADEIATAVEAGAQVIGINNRDLHTFVTDLATTESLAPLIPQARLSSARAASARRKIWPGWNPLGSTRCWWVKPWLPPLIPPPR